MARVKATCVVLLSDLGAWVAGRGLSSSPGVGVHSPTAGLHLAVFWLPPGYCESRRKRENAVCARACLYLQECVSVCLCIYVCVSVLVSVCMNVSVYLSACRCIYVPASKYLTMCMCVYLCMSVSMCVCLYVSASMVYVCVSVHLCVGVCLCVGMYLYVRICLYGSVPLSVSLSV